ncbi:ABC transporter ATP-binding protein [Kaistia dalseonensis]|uniref:Peptide/nickel transport system ATP-binding protein n=1 Tax=Kaistia dalseonensis TaxID=410840 RepID=A0ABU0H1U1_9HYPH|nr:ABC transporter ATP-binding protein [Kaistia dalseonensis]MCX5493719.1 ABC transporter ATP-binding protein [Kaistia dalseonensis]MDQ0436283.1 peptide/nickel transport system ATP-binding protein [Kaistia dalseonensis]
MLLQVSDLAIRSRSGGVRILDGVDLQLGAGEVLGLVGESGCGKSMTCYAIADLLPAGLVRAGGSVRFDGVDMGSLDEPARRRLRGGRIAMIFQDPTSHLNPVHRVGTYLEGALKRHRGLSGTDARMEAIRLLERVGISDAKRRMNAYPHEFSGGMNQRLMIAHALACEPDLLIADEPTTALDVTTQAQILDLIETVRAETGMAILIVSHDLGVIARLADRAAVMHCGRIVETAPVEALFDRPAHPYTSALIGCMPTVDPDDCDPPRPIRGSVPSLADLPGGCHFHPRCDRRMPACGLARPPLAALADGQSSACFNPVPTW